MNRILVAVFPREVRAHAGLRALEDLDREGTIMLFAAAVIVNDDESRVRVTAAADGSPLGTSVALLTGSLLGPLAGPVGLAVAAGVGMLGRVLYDLARLGVEEDFVAEIGERLLPGTAAVVAEVWEERITPVDARIAALGGSVLRRVRKEIVDAQLDREVTAVRAELASLRAELASTREQDRAHLEERIEAARTKLRAAQRRARAVLDGVTKECAAKVGWLEARAANARGEARTSVDACIADVRGQCMRRRENVRQTWEAATKELTRASGTIASNGSTEPEKRRRRR